MNKVLPSVIGLVAAIVGGFIALQFAPQPANYQQPSDQQFGSVSSNEVTSNFFCVGGVCTYSYSVPMSNASTTCMQKTPGATSTIMTANFITSTAPTTTPMFEIGTDPNIDATTTSLAKWTFTANTNKTVNATTTATATLAKDSVIGPNQFVSVKQGGGGGSFVPIGTCNFVFQTVSKA